MWALCNGPAYLASTVRDFPDRVSFTDARQFTRIRFGRSVRLVTFPVERVAVPPNMKMRAHKGSAMLCNKHTPRTSNPHRSKSPSSEVRRRRREHADDEHQCSNCFVPFRSSRSFGAQISPELLGLLQIGANRMYHSTCWSLPGTTTSWLCESSKGRLSAHALQLRTLSRRVRGTLSVNMVNVVNMFQTTAAG